MPKTERFKPGCDFGFTITRCVNGAPVSVTGFTVRAWVKARNGTIVCALTSTALTQSGDTLGMTAFSATGAQTELWPVGDLRFDVAWTDPNGLTDKLETVTIPVTEDITPNA